MITLKDVLVAIRDNDDSYTFTPDSKLPAADFQVVVEHVHEAYFSGYIETMMEHRSSRTGEVDLIHAKQLTDEGVRQLTNL